MFEKIPEELKALPQWVCIWKDSKTPMKAWEYKAASSSDPGTWSDFDTAENAVKNGFYDNIGFVFADNGVVGIDIDTGFNENLLATPLAADIMGACESYTEKSRSGRGFHILLKGKLPFNGKNNLNGVEIYQAKRYFIMTGNALVYYDLRENQPALDYVLEKYFPDVRPEKSEKAPSNRVYSPIWEKPENGRIKLRPVYPRIPNGCRNICLTSLAGMLHNQGYSKRQIYDELTYCNTVACDPCLPKNELETIVKSVTRYKR